MIKDKIKFTPDFAKENSKVYADAGVEVEGIEPERLWRNLTNISVWPKIDRRIVDIQFEDSAQTDPHLFDKTEFYYDMPSGHRVRCAVIYCVHPKDDRPGRLAYEGAVFDENGKQINELVAEFLVGVPDSHMRLDLACALSAREENAGAAEHNLGDELLEVMRRLADYARKHD